MTTPESVSGSCALRSRQSLQGAATLLMLQCQGRQIRTRMSTFHIRVHHQTYVCVWLVSFQIKAEPSEGSQAPNAAVSRTPDVDPEDAIYKAMMAAATNAHGGEPMVIAVQHRMPE